VRVAAKALAPLAREHQLIITHGNGPQVGLLALQSAAGPSDEGLPLDILDAETEGMIGYLIEQELGGLLPDGVQSAVLLTQIEVDPADPAFASPSKPIGPVYEAAQASQLARERGWRIGRDGEHFRRVVASPRPRRILELGVIELLASQGVVVICAGGGGIPVVRRHDGSLVGVEAVIDKDAASALLAAELDADALLMLTDVDAVYLGWGGPEAEALHEVTATELRRHRFAPGSMAPKVEAACDFVTQGGRLAGIGALGDAQAILEGRTGTRVTC
jgi:carbamate kinase